MAYWKKTKYVPKFKLITETQNLSIDKVLENSQSTVNVFIKLNYLNKNSFFEFYDELIYICLAVIMSVFYTNRMFLCNKSCTSNWALALLATEVLSDVGEFIM